MDFDMLSGLIGELKVQLQRDGMVRLLPGQADVPCLTMDQVPRLEEIRSDPRLRGASDLMDEWWSQARSDPLTWEIFRLEACLQQLLLYRALGLSEFGRDTSNAALPKTRISASSSADVLSHLGLVLAETENELLLLIGRRLNVAEVVYDGLPWRSPLIRAVVHLARDSDTDESLRDMAVRAGLGRTALKERDIGALATWGVEVLSHRELREVDLARASVSQIQHLIGRAASS